MADENDLSYRLDKLDRIVEVGGERDRVALENDGSYYCTRFRQAARQNERGQT